MSYEGFVRVLCASGHQRVFDCQDSRAVPCSCGQPFVWTRYVDETNGYERESDPPLEIDIPAVTARCNLGCDHVMQEARLQNS